VVYLTARTRADGSDALDTPAVRDLGATLVFYMASHVATKVETALIAAGRDQQTPVMVVENAGADCAKAITCQLEGLGDEVQSAGFTGPTLIVVGAVAGMARAATALVDRIEEINGSGSCMR